jgi:hypothetical protein
MRVHNGKITEHWGVANLFSLMQLLGAFAHDKKSYALAVARTRDIDPSAQPRYSVACL